MSGQSEYSRQACPDPERLKRFLSGRLNANDIQQVTAHLSECGDCELQLQTLESEFFSSIEPLIAAGQNWPHLHEKGLRRMEEAAQGIAVDRIAIGLDPDLPENVVPVGVPRRIGQYELFEKLGQGGMGAVYRARHVNLKRDVALKLLPADRGTNHVYLARFYREMEAIGKIDSPHVVCATDAGEADGWHYLVMEYAPGIDVGKIVQARGRLAVADACEIIRQAALGLAAIDEHGLVHRDIKPSNLLLTESGQVKLLDLGLARIFQQDDSSEELTGSQHVLGTVAYMAPEQVNETRGVDIRADIYALGCTFFKLLTGKVPFGAPQFKTRQQKLLAHLSSDPPDIRQLRPDAPWELTVVLERMLVKQPDNRFQKPNQIVEEVKRFAVGSNLSTLCENTTGSVLGSLGANTQSESNTPVVRRSRRPVAPRFSTKPLTLLLIVTFIGATLLIARATKDWYSDGNDNPHAVKQQVDTNGPLSEQMPAVPLDRKPSYDLHAGPLQTGVKHALLEQQPKRLLWPGDELATLEFRPPENKIAIHTRDVALL